MDVYFKAVVLLMGQAIITDLGEFFRASLVKKSK